MKSKYKNFIKKIKRIVASRKKNIYISFGENCLPDNILERYNLKSFSSPFSFGRGNVEYILNAENDSYKDFLNPAFLQKVKEPGGDVVRLTNYTDIRNCYISEHMKGFEFTHHDVLDNIQVREKMKRRCERQLEINKKKILFIFYFHRNCESTNEEMICEDLTKLKDIYMNRYKAVNIIFFYQRLVEHYEDRCVKYLSKNGIHIFEFFTLNEWRGRDENIFWARCDDDLIKIMIDRVRKNKF